MIYFKPYFGWLGVALILTSCSLSKSEQVLAPTPIEGPLPTATSTLKPTTTVAPSSTPTAVDSPTPTKTKTPVATDEPKLELCGLPINVTQSELNGANSLIAESWSSIDPASKRKAIASLLVLQTNPITEDILCSMPLDSSANCFDEAIDNQQSNNIPDIVDHCGLFLFANYKLDNFEPSPVTVENEEWVTCGFPTSITRFAINSVQDTKATNWLEIEGKDQKLVFAWMFLLNSETISEPELCSLPDEEVLECMDLFFQSADKTIGEASYLCGIYLDPSYD